MLYTTELKPLENLGTGMAAQEAEDIEMREERTSP
jgi:hypothetical protein